MQRKIVSFITPFSKVKVTRSCGTLKQTNILAGLSHTLSIFILVCVYVVFLYYLMFLLVVIDNCDWCGMSYSHF